MATVTIPGITAVAVFAALQGDGQTGFWSHHPLLGSLFAGSVLLVITAFGVEELLRVREAQRWSIVAQVAYRSLGIVLRNALSELVALHVDAEVVRRANNGPWKYIDLTPARELKNLPAWRLSLSIFEDPRLPSVWGIDDSPHPRLRFLMTDAEWCRAACDRVEAIRNEARVHLREWATLMIHAREPRGQIDDFARITDHLTALHGSLQQVDYAHRTDAEVPPVLLEEVVAMWDMVDFSARNLVNELWAASNSEYRFRTTSQIKH